MSRTDFDPTVPTLTNPQADRVRTVRGLAQRATRRRAGQYLVEGPQAVRELVRWSPERVRDVYLTPDAAARYPEIVQDAAGLFRHLGTPEVLAAMSPDAQGVLAVATPPDAARAGNGGTVGPLDADALPAVLATGPRLIALLARVRDPGNLGTVIRVADAAGADAVVVAGDAVEVTNPKVVRSTAGSLFHLPVVHGLSVPDAVAALRAAGSQVLAADGAGTHDLDDLQDAAVRGEPGRVDLRRPTTWLFGNEAWGLPAEDRDAADAVVRVPLRGHAESLNLATAAAVCLYASSRAHR
ncbi:TrmH family RNA methyltransferase [Cellulomonas denverensis]|uniref:TrmH family RNA methyltransferase n=1 Tax=Cellulomonas denverensis TaxID=264297 RepID=UPI001A50DF9A|nr:RNA methyltransferase [Cellulomonas denverensis]GIG27115.1 RNA methyltransferase [Cellulomonas denverensis]